MDYNSEGLLNVLFASNEAFAPYLSVAMYSLLENNSKDFDKINIFVFDDGITEQSKDKLVSVSDAFNGEMQFIPLTNIQEIIGNKIHSMEKEGVDSLTTYARLFASSALPNVDKLLYLDADSLILGSFKDLWDLDMGDNYIGGVEDLFNIDYIKKEIGLEKHNKYINAGFLLINLKKWREVDIEAKFIEFLIDHSDRFIFHDQGIINGVCKDKVLYIDPKYNLISLFHGIPYKKAIKMAGIPGYYDEATVKNAQKNPVFLHFSGGVLNRPWSNKNQPYYKLYYEYVAKTPFDGEVELADIAFKDELFYMFYQSRILTWGLNLIPISFCIKFANKRAENLCKRENNKK